MPQPLAAAPAVFVAGDTVAWYQAAADTPPPTWTLTVRLTGPATAEATATNDDGRHLVTLAASATAELPAGTYRWQARASSGSEAYTIASGTFDVQPDPITLAGNAGQATAERHLAAIEAALAGRWTSDVEEYEIAGRRLRKIPVETLVKLRAQFAAEVRRLRRGGVVGTPLLVQFTRAGFP